MQRRTEEDLQNYMEILGLAKKKIFSSKTKLLQGYSKDNN
jgi:hypothetical protein